MILAVSSGWIAAHKHYVCEYVQCLPISTKATTISATSGCVRPPNSANAFALRANSLITAKNKTHTLDIHIHITYNSLLAYNCKMLYQSVTVLRICRASVIN